MLLQKLFMFGTIIGYGLLVTVNSLITDIILESKVSAIYTKQSAFPTVTRTPFLTESLIFGTMIDYDVDKNETFRLLL